MRSLKAWPDAWRARAAELDRYAPAAAEAFRVVADELESSLNSAADEPLTLGIASAESGYSKRRLRELIADGTIPQSGRKGAPRIRRGDLPVRPGRRSELVHGPYDPATDADALAGRMW